MESREWEIWDDKKVVGMARTWHNPSASEEKKHQRLTKEVYSLIEGNSVLDVACGMGHLYALAKDNLEYLGVDTSQAMLSEAKDSYQQGQDKFRFGDAYDLSALSDFDTVVATGLILHLSESESVIKQLWSRARICVVLSAWVGETPLFWKTKHPPSLEDLIQMAKVGRLRTLKGLLSRGESWKIVWTTFKHLILQEESKELIQRRETVEHLSQIFKGLKNLAKVEELPFHNPVDGESNYIFKLWKAR